MYNSKTQTFDNIESLKEVGATEDALVSVLGYYTANDGGGGMFIYDTTSEADDDGGLVIQPTVVSGAGRWLRIVNPGPYNLLWWGAQAADVAFDNLPIIEAAMASIPNIPTTPGIINLKGVIYIPRANDKYYFSDTINIYNSMAIWGAEGSDSFMATNLLFPADVDGIVVHNYNETPSARGAYFFEGRNFTVWSTVGSDGTKCGLRARRTVTLFNVVATSFSGHGIFIDTISNGGIADLCNIENCSAYTNGVDGLRFEGVDSNQCVTTNFNAFGNRRWGINDQSFLGNTFISCHTNANSQVPGNLTWIFYGGTTYYCRLDNTNVEPTVTSGWADYWAEVNTGTVTPNPVFPAWNNSTAYKRGGCYNSREAVNSNSTWLAMYSELNQAPATLATRNILIGGIHGAGFDGINNILTGEGNVYSYTGFKTGAAPGQDLSIDSSGISVIPVGGPADGAGIGLYFDTGQRWFVSKYKNTAAHATYYITTEFMLHPEWLGRSVGPEAGILFPQGLFLGQNEDLAKGRMVEMSVAAPTLGEHGVGDISIKLVSGAADPIFGWRCTAAGTPGTWEILYAKLTP